MIKDDRRLWKLILLTIPTLGIYNIYFWFHFTKDLNEMNQEEKKIKNYFLVLFLSIITLGIYRWVWLFYLEDRLQTTGKKLGVQVHPGPGTTLVLWTFGKFILVGPFLADLFLINNMNKLANAYNASLPKKRKKKKDTAAGKPQKTVSTANTDAIRNTPVPNTETVPNRPVISEQNRQAITTPAAAMNRSTKAAEKKPQVINKQVITPEKPATNTISATNQKTSAAGSHSNIQKETAATKESGSKTPAPKAATNKVSTAKDSGSQTAAPKASGNKASTAKDSGSQTAAPKDSGNKATTNPGTVTLDVEKNRPRANDATLTVNPGLTNMPMGNNKK